MSPQQNTFSNIIFFAFVLFTALSLDGCSPTPKPTSKPTYSLNVTPSSNLSDPEKVVEKRFSKYLEENTDEAIAKYRKQYGYIVNTDNVRELSVDYAPNGPESNDLNTINARTKWTNAVHAPSGALAALIYERLLTANTIVFTAGGAGSGKSSAIGDITELRNELAYAQIVFDTTLSNESSSMFRIQEALNAGKDVSIIFVYRDPIEALVNGALPRAMEMGRTLTLNGFAATHLGAPEVLAAIAKKYKGDPRVEIAVVDNGYGKGKAKLVTEDLGDFFRSREQTPKELISKLELALEGEHNKGKITDEVYNAFMGKI